MQIVNQPVHYAERCIRTSSGTAVVWPFLNAEKGPGPYELFLDTNALSNVQWFAQLPEEIRTKCVINPWPALQEQWLSNPQFREATTDRINAMIEGLARLGAPFRDHFAQQQERLLRRNDAALRTQFSLIIPYIVIMKSLLTQRLALRPTVVAASGSHRTAGCSAIHVGHDAGGIGDVAQGQPVT